MTTNEWMIAMGAMLFLPVILIPLSLIMIKMGRGFNTFSRAALTREAQIFAARMMGGMLLRVSLIMVVFILGAGGIGIAFVGNDTILMTILWVTIVVSLLIILVPFVITELAVRRRFDKNGRPYKS